MRIHNFPRFNVWLQSGLLVLLAAAIAQAAYTPPSAIKFNATSYADRASRLNATGISSLAAYVSPAACPAKVNLFSQDVTYSVPLLFLTGRAGLNLSLTLSYNSKVWIKSGTTMFFDGEQSWPAPGWRLGFGRIDGVFSGPDSYNHYYYIASDESVHDLRYNSTDSLYESIDSTYLDFSDSTGVLRMKDGTQITFAVQGGTGGYLLPTQVKDRNGNYITVTYTGTGQQISSIVDTVGRTTSFTYNSDGTLASISKSGFGNASRTWSFGYTSYTMSYSFASSLTVNAPTSAKLLTSITNPNSTSQVFTYNGYGQLTEADLKSSSGTLRGKILASWESAPSGGWATSPIPASVGNNDGSNTNTWSLSFGTYTTSVTDPNSVETTTSFFQTGDWEDGLPEQQQIGATALKTVANTWSDDSSALNPRLTQVLTTLNDTSQQSEIQTDYTTYGNPSEIREYDYGVTLNRSTDYSYITNSNYTSRHILNLRATSIVYNGSSSSGTKASSTTYAYDGSPLASAAGASNHDDTNYGTGFAYRGLMTSITQYSNPVTPAGAITHSTTYDMLGNTLTTTADCCIQQTANYSSTTQYSQPDTIVSGAGTTLTTSVTYDSYTGLIASSTDANNQTTHLTYDVMDRLSSSTRPDATVVSTSYDDSSANPAMTVTTPITSSTSSEQTTLYDGLLRPIRGTVLDASSTVYSKSDTQYDGLAQVSQTSLPYTGSTASYWVQVPYDALGRATKVIPPDGSSSSNNVSYSYSGNTIITTDEAGNQTKSKLDAFGRTIETDEPDPSNGNSLTVATTYAYDALNNLTQISQGSQTRSYVYDGLSRKTSETTPETGNITYQYNSYGSVTQRTDARGVVTSYTYDSALNRLTQVSYNVGSTGVPATPMVTYAYGTAASSYNNGRLITMTDGLGSESYTYDQLGRTTQIQKVINNVTYTTSYMFNLANQVVTMTYPSLRVVKYNYDAIGRSTSIQNTANSSNYASSIAYNTANEVTGFNYLNGVTASYGYSAQRLQLTSLSYTEGSQSLFSETFSYTQGGGNNGQIASITDNAAAGRSASYTHDALGRLTAASTTGSTGYPRWGMSWTYDRYGNRTAQSETAGSVPTTSPAVSTSTNQITSMGGSNFSYDASGNPTKDDLYKYKTDAENRLVEVDQLNGTLIATYAYDGNSNLAVKVFGAGRTYYLYQGSQLISEFEDAASNTYTSGTTPNSAVDDYYATLLFHHQDQVSTRVTTDNSGVLASTLGTYPFGDSWYASGVADPSIERRFASTMKDYATASAELNSALSQFYSARLGRLQSASLANVIIIGSPQSSNGYTGAGDDPTDPQNNGGKPGDSIMFMIIDISGGAASAGGNGPGFGVVGGSTGAAIAALAAQGAYADYMDTFMSKEVKCTGENQTGTCLDPQSGPTLDAYLKYTEPGSILTGIQYAPNTALPTMPKVGASKEEWVAFWNALIQYYAALDNYVYNIATQTPSSFGGGPQSPTSSTATCNLTSNGFVGTCSYNCGGGGSMLFGSYSTTVSALKSPCSLPATTTQCPSQIQIKGVTIAAATVVGCSGL